MIHGSINMAKTHKLTLKDLCNRYGTSMSKLSKKLGISRQALSYWNLGESFPSKENLDKLKEHFGLKDSEVLVDDKGIYFVIKTEV